MSDVVRRDRRGQSLVEFALLLPVLLLIVLSLFDVGRAVLGYSTLANAARVGARVAIVNQSNDATCTGSETFKCAAAAGTTGLGVDPATIPDLVITGTGCPEIGCDATVTITYQYRPITPFVSNILGPITLSASATMKVERAYSNP